MVSRSVVLLAMVWAGTVQAAGLKYWIEPCTKPAETGCRAADPDLAQWAMEAWQAGSDGKLRAERTPVKEQALIKIYWVSARTGLYGETRGGMSTCGRTPAPDCCGRLPCT